MKKHLLLIFTALISFHLYSQKSFDIDVFTFTEKIENTTVSVKVKDTNISGLIEIPGKVEYENTSYSVTEIEELGFADCSSLTAVIIPEEIERIGEGAFESCYSIENLYCTNVMAPELGAFAIGGISPSAYLYIHPDATGYEAWSPEKKKAFITNGILYLCLEDAPTDLRAISLTTEINKDTPLLSVINGENNDFSTTEIISEEIAYVLSDTPGEFKVSMNRALTKSDVKIQSYFTLGAIQVPVTSIEIGAFSNSSLSTLYIPGSIKNIGANAFMSCNSLKDVFMEDGIETIGSQCFAHCAKLETVRLPQSISELNERIFWSCGLLKNIIIPESVKQIGAVCFQMCMSLESVTFNEELESIGEHAFGFCNKLDSIILPQSLKTIDASAFSGCSSVEFLHLGESLENIGKSAFFKCTSLKEIHSKAMNAPELGETVFTDIDEEALLHIYEGAAGYQREGWPLFIDDLEEILTNTTINRISANINVYISGNSVYIKSDKEQRLTIYSINGISYIFDLTEGSNKINLPKGIYIINGKKISI